MNDLASYFFVFAGGLLPGIGIGILWGMGRVSKRPDQAIELIVRLGGIGGDHHKAWVLDQVVRTLAGDEYDALVADACDGEDGPDTYGWDEGIPP